jgi:hypothetical protein
MVRCGLYQTTSNAVVKDVTRALGLRVLGSERSFAVAPSPSVAFDSELVMPVIPSGSAMLVGATLGGSIAGGWRKAKLGVSFERVSSSEDDCLLYVRGHDKRKARVQASGSCRGASIHD